uniref:Uncharacterized protein n=1 Tax=Arundo donax TaxID=35708 RepID=A0A0A9ATB6_ARUDO
MKWKWTWHRRDSI